MALPDNSKANGQRSWAVAVHRRDVAGELELANATCRCLAELGYPAQIVQDGEPAGMQADVLLLLPNAANFAAYADRLRQVRSKRPFVVVWQMDALPPTNLSPKAQRYGLEAAAWRRRLGLVHATGSMPRWEKLTKAVRLRGRLYRLLSGFGYRRCSRLAAEQVGAKARWDWKLMRGAMECWESLRQSLIEGWIDRVAVSTRQRQDFLAERQIDAPFIPVGGCPEWGSNLSRPRDVDVLFLGRVKQSERAQKLNRLDRELGTGGITIRRITRDCFGTARTQWLNRTRLVLNLNQYPWSPAWIRFVMASLCEAAVVSEPMQDREPFTEGVHYASAPEEHLSRLISELLRDGARRQRLSEAAAAHCRSALTLRRSIQSLVSLVEDQPR